MVDWEWHDGNPTSRWVGRTIHGDAVTVIFRDYFKRVWQVTYPPNLLEVVADFANADEAKDYAEKHLPAVKPE